MQELKINGVRYALKIHQKNASLPCLLMLHGFMGNHRVFDHLIDDLKKYCSPITVDLLGHGQSEQAQDPSRYVAKHQIDDLETLIRRLKISPLFLYGYSMGGRLALRTALQFPGKISGLILESTNDGIEDEPLRKERRSLDKKRADKIVEDFDLFLSNWKELELFQSSVSTDETLEKKYHAIQHQQNPASLAASLKGFSNGNMKSVRSKLGSFHKPVLLLAGNEDEKYLKINDTMAQHFANARFLKLNAGHRVHLDNPKELTNHITQFIEQKS